MSNNFRIVEGEGPVGNEEWFAVKKGDQLIFYCETVAEAEQWILDLETYGPLAEQDNDSSLEGEEAVQALKFLLAEADAAGLTGWAVENARRVVGGSHGGQHQHPCASRDAHHGLFAA